MYNGPGGVYGSMDKGRASNKWSDGKPKVKKDQKSKPDSRNMKAGTNASRKKKPEQLLYLCQVIRSDD